MKQKRAYGKALELIPMSAHLVLQIRLLLVQVVYALKVVQFLLKRGNLVCGLVERSLHKAMASTYVKNDMR